MKWNPYPKKRPPRDGRYLVTYNDGDGTEVCILTFIDWSEDNQPDGWEDEIQELPRENVKAWAELPFPYYPRNKNKK